MSDAPPAARWARWVRRLIALIWPRVAQELFNLSDVMRVPIEVDEHDLYRHRFDLVWEVDEQVASLHMRMSLGKIHDDLHMVVDRLASRVQHEVHGAGS